MCCTQQLRMKSLLWLGGLCLLLEWALCQNVQLKLPLGTLTGKRLITTKGTRYYSFQKIPFAEPPVGDLRFKAPVPKKNSRTVYDNTNDDVVCYQGLDPIAPYFQGKENEDCLYLSIYTPQLPLIPLPFGLSVLVYFYGGQFMVGGFSKEIFGPDFMMDENIIVAVVNYRLGAFGFLSTNDAVIPGNAGLKDQLLALQWIFKNIPYFGGDPLRITIGGESAGSASTTYLLMARKARGFFRGVISESGSALNPWAYQRNARNVAFQLAKIIDPSFNSTDSTALSVLLRNVTAERLKNATVTLNNIVTVPVQAFMGIIFAPVIEVEHEGAFITQKQYVALDKGNVSRVPLLIGFSSEEAISLGAAPGILKSVGQVLDNNTELLIPYSLQLKPGVDKAAVAQEIKRIYVPNGNFADNPGALIRYVSDNLFTRGIIKTAELMSKWTRVYFYQFSYSGKMGGPIIVVEGADRVGHGGEHIYLWRVNTTDLNNTDLSKFPKEDIRTHYRLLEMFTNFVKYQNPSTLEAVWPNIRASGTGKFLYMDINTTLSVKNQPKSATYPKWNAIYNRDGIQPFTTF